MTKRNSTVVRIAFLNQNMPVETAHFLNGKYTDTAKGTGLYRQNLTLYNIASKLAFKVTLQAVKGYFSCGNVSLKSTASKVRLRILRLKEAVLNKLVFNGAIRAHFTGRSIAAMETHENIRRGVGISSFDMLVVH